MIYYIWIATIMFFVLGIVWINSNYLNMFIKFVLISMGAIGIFFLMQANGLIVAMPK
jgi:hypothetical protein